MPDHRSLQHDAAVIGGGPAGSTAAAFLASSGYDVALFERKNFPRDVLCGEFLSAEVIQKIKELNLLTEFQSLNPNSIRSFKFINRDGKSISTNFDFPAYALRRADFDMLLLENCRRRGVTIYQPAEVCSIKKKNKSFSLEVRTKAGVINLNSKFVIASYGRQNRLDKTFNRKFVHNKSPLNAMKFHLDKNAFRFFQEDEIIIFSGEKIYCGLNQINGGKITVCFLEKRSLTDKPARLRLIRNVESNPFLSKMFNEQFYDSIATESIYGTGNIYFKKKEKFKDGIFFIGDAAGLIAPLAGDGIAMAMESGKLISDVFIASKERNFSLEKMAELYELRWNKLFSKRIQSSLLIQKILMNSFLTETGIYFNSIYPSLLKHLINVTRNYQFSTKLI